MFSAASAYVYYVNRSKLSSAQPDIAGVSDYSETMRFGRAFTDCMATACRSRPHPCGVGIRVAGAKVPPSAASVSEVVYGTAAAEVVTWTPPLCVKAHDFTAYLDAPADPHAAWDAPGVPTLDILVECRRLAAGSGTPSAAEQGDPDNKVKLTDLCRPVAWRPGNPLGILATCSRDQMTKLAEAFARRALAIDDDIMDIEQIAAVKVDGSPRQLLRYESAAPSVAFDEVDEAFEAVASGASDCNGFGAPYSDLRRLADDDAPLEVAMHRRSSGAGRASSEHAASAVLLGPWRSRGAPTSALEASGGGYPSGSSFSVSEAVTWSTSSLDDAENLGSAGDAAPPSGFPGDAFQPETLLPPQSPWPMKPPNVLVCTGSTRGVAGSGADAAFVNVTSLLESCLLPYSYAVYRLDSSEAAGGRAPWADNCAALFLTPETAQLADNDGFVGAVTEYFRSGGIVVSLCSGVDRRFVHMSDYCAPDPDGDRLPQQLRAADVQTAGGVTFKACLGSSRYPRDPQCNIPDTEVSVAACDQAGNPVAIEVLGCNHGGRMVLLRVHVEMGASAAAANGCDSGELGGDRLFRQFVDAGRDRLAFLQSLLHSCGLRVSDQVADSGRDLQPTPCILLATDSKLRSDFVDAVKRCKQLLDGWLGADGGTLRHADVEYDLGASGAVSGPQAAAMAGFDWSAYVSALTSRRLGRVVLYQQVSRTTQAILEPFMLSLPDHVCAVAIASSQTKGKGRSGNSWLSPPGCAMATLHVRVPLHSPLGQAPAFIQMVPAVATAMAVRTLPGYENVDIKVKWPNDIYYGSRAKLGGVLVQSTLMGSEFHALVGFGINVSNQHPTCCINDAVAQAAALSAGGGSDGGACRPLLLTVEVVIARVITLCEHLVDLFQRDKSAFIKLYYEHWLHAGGSTVLIQEHSDASADAAAAYAADPHRPAPPPPTEGRIDGVDEAGYLVVSTVDGRRLSLQPDGNTFDIMRNLIVRKKL